MEVLYKVISLLGGLALFLYGMRIMGDGLKSNSGGAMKAVLTKITNKPAMGFLLGMLVTCMIQSSTATIVLAVGLVGAGFITFRQSIGIVLGANVGTAITAQIIRLMDVDADSGSLLFLFKSDNLAPMALILGIVMIMFVKTKASTSIGTVCMGFGILFVGLMNMSAAVSEFGDAMSNLLMSFEDNYVLGFLSGVLVTGIIQSSSAVVGILQSIASSVGVTFCGVFAIIIGVNIGDCITTYLVCRIGAKPEQIKTCLVHIIYNVFAAALIIAAITIGRFTGLISDDLWNMTMNSGGVANIHGLFRLIPAILLLPCAGLFARIAEAIVKDTPVDEEDSAIEEALSKLDMHLITNPGLALGETEMLVDTMAEVALHNYQAAIQQLFDFEEKREDRIKQREDMLDRMADAASQYIIAISPYITLDRDHNTSSFLLKAVVSFERAGDLAINIIETLRDLRDSGVHFSEDAARELKVALQSVGEVLQIAAEACNQNSVELARKIEPLEEVNDELIEYLHSNHVKRMLANRCNAYVGLFYQNILLNLERVSDQCSDLGVALLARYDDSIRGDEHKYIHNLHHSNTVQFTSDFEAYHSKYFGMLDQDVESA